MQKIDNRLVRARKWRATYKMLLSESGVVEESLSSLEVDAYHFAADICLAYDDLAFQLKSTNSVDLYLLIRLAAAKQVALSAIGLPKKKEATDSLQDYLRQSAKAKKAASPNANEATWKPRSREEIAKLTDGHRVPE